MFNRDNPNKISRTGHQDMPGQNGPRRRLLACVAAAMALWAAGATAQVRQVQSGNALDANPQIGSGGYNSARPVSTGINGNLIMSGNVTGGRAFQGFSPIGNPNTLQTTIPSANLSPFIRDSVGLPGIQSGLSNTAPRPYFDPSQTAVSSGTIEAGALLSRDLGGTYRAGQGQYQTPVTSLGGTQPLGQYGGQLPYAAPVWTPAGIGMFNPDVIANRPGEITSNPLTQLATSGPLSKAAAGKAPEIQPAEGLSQAGPQGQSNQTVLPGKLERQTEPGSQDQQSGAGQPNIVPQDVTLSLAKPNAGNLAAGKSLEPLQPGTSPRADEQTVSSLLTQMQQYTGAAKQAVAPGSEQPQGQMLTQNQQKPLNFSVDEAAHRPSDDLRLLQSGMTAAQRQQMQTDIGRQQASRLVEQRIRTPIRSLAGARQTQVDRILAQAEDLMRAGEYYKAAGAYNGVIAAAPDNALAWLGRANALLAAGEYLQAYVALESGISRFPQVLEFDLDLPALLGNREILDVRRAELETLLTGKPDYRMQFLLGYLDYYSGQRSLGLQVIKQAAKVAPAGSIVPQAKLILERQAAPASQPANG